MKDLALFTETLKAKQQQEWHNRFVLAQTDWADKLEQFKLQANGSYEKSVALLNEQLSAQQQIELQKIHNRSRNEVLVEKQNLMLALFDKAVDRLNGMDSNTLERFFNSIIKQLPHQQYVLTCGELTPVTFALPSHIQLVKEVVPQEGGFLFTANGVDYNYLFKTLVNDLKPTYLSELLQTLQQ